MTAVGEILNRLRDDSRLYYAACICLLIAAVALRFYDLGGDSLWYDEAVAANNSRGSFSEAVERTRHSNSSPILYPLVLWAVQKVESSAFTVRMVPAAASVGTVAVLLFLLPRVGVSRWAAFMAALLATVSAEAIRHAQEVREYSVDALVAALMIIGLLSHLQVKNGGARTSVLLCVSLFVAPLVQYGLVLFGIAVFATIALVETGDIFRRRDTLREGLRPYIGRAWSKLRGAAWPAASFTAGCAVSYAATLRYQWREGGFGAGDYLAGGYYSGELTDARAILEFVIVKTWQLFYYPLPELLTLDFLLPQSLRTIPDSYKPELFLLAAFLGLGVFLIVSVRKVRFDTITILFLLSIAIMLCAAMLRIYPHGGRHSVYLTPIIFIMLGCVFHSLASATPVIARREWLPHVMTLLAAIVILGGAIGIIDRKPYDEYESYNSVRFALEEREQEGDIVYVSGGAHAVMKFYYDEKPDNHYYIDCRYLATIEACIDDVLEAQATPTNRLWLVFSHWKGASFKLLEELIDGIQVEHVVDEDFSDLYLLEAPNLFDLLAKPIGSLKVKGELIIESDFDVYLNEKRLTYVKEPCSPSNFEEKFFLHVYPTDLENVPEGEIEYGGFDNSDFHFQTSGTISGERCVAVHDLPAYDIARIVTGQFIYRQGQLWQGEYQFGE